MLPVFQLPVEWSPPYYAPAATDSRKTERMHSTNHLMHHLPLAAVKNEYSFDTVSASAISSSDYLGKEGIIREVFASSASCWCRIIDWYGSVGRDA